MAFTAFLPTLFRSLSAVFIIALCCFAIRRNFLRGPSTLVLTSSFLAFLLSVELVLYKIQKAFDVPILPKDHWSLLTTTNRYADFVSRFVFLVGVLWLFLVILRHRKTTTTT
jgi:hypothetical protein